MLTKERLDEIKAFGDAAGLDKWRSLGGNYTDYRVFTSDREDFVMKIQGSKSRTISPEIAFMWNLPRNYAALIAALEEAWARIEELESA